MNELLKAFRAELFSKPTTKSASAFSLLAEELESMSAVTLILFSIADWQLDGTREDAIECIKDCQILEDLKNSSIMYDHVDLLVERLKDAGPLFDIIEKYVDTERLYCTGEPETPERAKIYKDYMAELKSMGLAS